MRLVGRSLGCSTHSYLLAVIACDPVLAVDESGLPVRRQDMASAFNITIGVDLPEKNNPSVPILTDSFDGRVWPQRLHSVATTRATATEPASTAHQPVP